MRICFSADLHCGGLTRSESIIKMVADIPPNNPDIIVLGGDIAESVGGPANFRKCLKMFRKVMPDIPIGIVLGNHDLWAKKGMPHNSYDLWTKILKSMAIDQRCIWLEDENFVSGGKAVVGSYLHYDYSAKDTVGPCSGFTDDYYRLHKGDCNADAHYLHGLPDDKTFASSVGEAFRKRLQQAQDDPQITDIAVVSHMPSLEEMVTRKPQDFRWSSGTPYFGNLSHQDLIKSCSKVRIVLGGHSHCEQSADVKRGNLPDIKAFNIGADYGEPKFVMFEI